MTGKQVANSITGTCEALQSLDLIKLFNVCIALPRGPNTRVSWRSSETVGANAHSFGSLEQYLAWLRAGEFTCILFDNSLIRASYDCIGNTIIGHSLLYWPCPVEFADPVDNLIDLCDGFELCLASPRDAAEVCELTMRSPMRFDFDPDRASQSHPPVHLHMQYSDTRIHVREPLSFAAFMKKIVRTFYFSHWTRHPEFAELHEHAIGDPGRYNDPAEHCFQLSWS